MSAVLLGLGSNLGPYRHISSALDALCERFGQLQVSPVFESEPVGCRGANYLNLVVALDTELPLAALSAWLKQLEDQCGRDRGPNRGRTLDIDILTYDACVGLIDGVQLPRDEITRNAFVLWPLAELVPDRLHPRLEQSYAALWQAYGRAQTLWPVDFDWRGRRISHADPHQLSQLRPEFLRPLADSLTDPLNDRVPAGVASAPRPAPSL